MKKEQKTISDASLYLKESLSLLDSLKYKVPVALKQVLLRNLDSVFATIKDLEKLEYKMNEVLVQRKESEIIEEK